MIRLVPDQSGQIRRSEDVSFTFDGQPVAAHAGETVLSALTRAGIVHLRDAPEDGAPRGAFCCMGLCQECTVRIDGCQIESCRVHVTDGLRVSSLKQAGHE
jgi:predicted molibdopterin-dependent oxidoreductase YjgC